MSIVNFRIKDSEKNVSKPREWVFVRIRVEQYEISTGLKVNRKHWSSSKQKVKNSLEANYADEINIKLDDLKSFVNREYTLSKANDTIISQRWLTDTNNMFFNKTTSEQDDSDVYFVERMKVYIKNKETDINPKTSRPRARRTIQDYETKLNKIIEYQNSKNIKLKLINIDLNFHKDFMIFLKKDKLITNNNTLKGYTDIIKQVCVDAKRDGLNVNLDIEKPDFYTPSQKTFDFALKKDEIDKIYNYNFKPFSKLDKVRDWFVIGLWTGLRISDFLQLETKDIEDDFITLTNKKTDIPVIIPLHENVKSILKKWNGKFPEKISDQKFNEYVKEVCKEIGFNDLILGSKKVFIKEKDGIKIYRKVVGNYPKHELVSSHICRRTFSSIHYGKIDTLTIMRITGHSTEKQFLDYVKIPPIEYAQRLKELWNKQKKANINIYEDV